jgi:GTP pyrophosphokinase
MQIQTLINKIKKRNPKANLELVHSAYNFAALKHAGQKRLSGEDYINHPLEVAGILADLDLDDNTIAAALLHDVIEDTDATKEDIEKVFGTKIAELVDGVTRLGTIDFSKLPSEEIQEAKFRSMIEDLRKFFLAMAKDIRVVIIKLADRLHNMRTLDALTTANQKRIARETLEIFAPLADRLGMGSMKAELEDLAFKYSNPGEYRRIADLLMLGEKERKHYLSKIKKFIQTELTKEGIEAEIDGRIKHLYSVYKKLQKVHGNISEIYDIMAIRIVVNSVEDCYRVLGIIHMHFKPLIYRIKDYISVPKPNGYQSLHTTVFGLDGNITEIQIRTKEMHEEAENGVAAHWHYDDTKDNMAYKGKSSFASADNLKWVNQITDLQKNVSTSEELAESLNIDFFNDRIYVTSPNGDIFELPDGATPIDFAYEVHTQLGHRCRGVKVNGKIANLDQKLHNRDMVEVILAPKNDQSGPPRGWLEFVVTAKAKQNIRSWYKHLNRDVNIEAGHKLFAEELSLFNMTEEELSAEDIKDIIGNAGWKIWDDVLAAIGDGTVTPRLIVKKIVGQKLYQAIDKKKSKVKKTTGEDANSITNLNGILIRYADCCKPKKGDAVKGFITQGMGITIHRADCRNLLTSPQERVVDINLDLAAEIEIKVEVRSKDRVGLIRDVTDVVSSDKINIVKIDNEHPVDDESIINLVIKASDPALITDLLPKLKNVRGVTRVRKQ